MEGIAEAIRHGQDGVIVPAGDHQAIAQAVADVIEGRYDWSAMRKALYERQAQFFSHRSMAEGVANVYRQVWKYDLKMFYKLHRERKRADKCPKLTKKMKYSYGYLQTEFKIYEIAVLLNKDL